MKVLSVAMAARWNSKTEEVVASLGSGKSSSATPWVEPSALDDNCARYILSVMVLYLRQTTPSETRLMSSSILNLDASFYDFESVDVPCYAPAIDAYCHDDAKPSTPHSAEPTLHSKTSAHTVNSGSSGSEITPVPMMPLSFNFDKTHMSLVRSSLLLNNHIGKFVGRIVYHLSASNWQAVFDRIRTKVHFLSSTSEDNPDTVDLRLMTNSVMDRNRLVQVLQGTDILCRRSACR
jgi:neurofibromin 1